MARDKTDKTDLTPPATLLTLATREGWQRGESLWSKKRSPREQYQFAVQIARAAIRFSKNHTLIRANIPSAQAKIAEYLAKQANGGTLPQTDLNKWAAAMAEQSKRRCRGRPKGTRDFPALAAFRAAAFVVQVSGVRIRARQCDAIADAMHAEGFRTRITHSAAMQEMKTVLHERRAFSAKVKTIASNIETAFQKWRCQIRDVNHTLTESFRSIQSPLQETARAWGEFQRRTRVLGNEPSALGSVIKKL